MAQPQAIHPSVLHRLDPEYIAFHNIHVAHIVPPHTLPWDPSIRTAGGLPGGSEPLSVGKIEDHSLSHCKVRVYTPEGSPPSGGWPVFIFYHGGGWTLGNIGTEASFSTNMCVRANYVVVSVDYRLGPEHPFPAAVEDAFEALQWVYEEGPTKLNISKARIAIGGSSSGGNLAAVASLKAAQMADPIPLVLQLLIVPVTDNTASTSGKPHKSWAENENTPWLSPERMLWFRKNYLPNEADWTNWESSPLFAPDELVGKTPSAWIGVTELDILRDEGLAYGEKLKKNGVSVKTTVYPAAPHPIMAMDGDMSKDACESVQFSPGDTLYPATRKEEERRLLRKYDLTLLPPLTLMYLCNALDKGNVGNAKTDGWDKDIHLSGNQYYLLVMIFYVPFCLCGTPISLLVKKYSAARILPLMMVGFGSMSLLAAAATNFGEIMTIRVFLGIFESAMLPGVVFYLSTFYKRNELASRIGLFYAAASIAGAFSGLIAFGTFQIHHSKYHGWQFLFWIEGGFSVLFAIFAWFWLPRSPATWKGLSEREKALARERILTDSSVEVDEQLNVGHAFRAFKDPMYWIWALINLSFGVPLASVNNFLPQIVASLGYSTIKTNLLTVAPNVAGTVALLLLTFSSDFFRERSIHICIPLAVAVIGFVVLGTIDPLQNRGVAYFATFLLTMGAFAPSVLVAAWYSNNTPNESQRAVVAAVMVAIANSAGLISTNVFRAKDEPRYIPGATQHSDPRHYPDLTRHFCSIVNISCVWRTVPDTRSFCWILHASGEPPTQSNAGRHPDGC
ncbi:hypothetical protein ONZ45_g14312 [Pleurotus djamor]|nr:hypothetical protein ONZ45_g14312 [Pleurotus djamor]